MTNDGTGLRIAFTLPASELKPTADEAVAKGFQVMGAPSIDVSKGEKDQFDLIQSQEGRDLVFTSMMAVHEVSKHFGDGFKPLLEGRKVYAVTPHVQAELKVVGVSAEIGRPSGALYIGGGTDLAGVPEGDRAEVLVTKPAGMSNGMLHILIALKRGELDWVLFTSPEAAENLLSHIYQKYGEDTGKTYLEEHVKIGAAGQDTAEFLRGKGLEPDLVSDSHGVEGILQKLS